MVVAVSPGGCCFAEPGLVGVNLVTCVGFAVKPPVLWSGGWGWERAVMPSLA